MTNKQIIFYLNNQYIRYTPDRTYISLLEFLRLNKELTGTKEGCGEGDCGACTVMLGEMTEHGIEYRTLNACIALMANLHNRYLLTPSGIGKPGALHPAQGYEPVGAARRHREAQRVGLGDGAQGPDGVWQLQAQEQEDGGVQVARGRAPLPCLAPLSG